MLRLTPWNKAVSFDDGRFDKNESGQFVKTICPFRVTLRHFQPRLECPVLGEERT